MKRTFFIVLGVVFFLPVFSQVVQSDSFPRTFIPRKFNIHLSMGSQFSSYSGYGSGLSTIVTPSIAYDVSKRLRLQGGVSIVNTNYFGARPLFSEQTNQTYNGNYMSALVFIGGQYLLNNKITISGFAFKEFPLMGDPLPYSPFQPYSKEGAQGIRMDVNYKIGENFQIQAGFGYTRGVNPYYSPYGNSIFVPADPYGIMPRW